MSNDLIKMPGEPGYPEGGYATRDKPTEAGWVEILATHAKGDYPVIALVCGELRTFTNDGKCLASGENSFDLIPLQPAAPAKWRQCWMNRYADDVTCGKGWPTKAAAASAAIPGAAAVNLIETAAVDGLVSALEHIVHGGCLARNLATDALRAYRERL